jgi:hypothetical protein
MMSSDKRKKWFIAALIVLILRFGIGPSMLGMQLMIGGSTFDGNCGNSQFQMPNTDLLSWGVSGGEADAFEQACVEHDQCYNTLGQRKYPCDRIFLRDMEAGCRDTFQAFDVPGWLTHIGALGCTLQAETYFLGVSVLPLVHYVYCIEQYYTRAGTREINPDPADVIRECRVDR